MVFQPTQHILSAFSFVHFREYCNRSSLLGIELSNAGFRVTPSIIINEDYTNNYGVLLSEIAEFLSIVLPVFVDSVFIERVGKVNQSDVRQTARA
jgi:hypothetical protein